MKYDIEKLKKVDFGKLKLSPVDTIQLAVGYNRTSVFIHSKETNVVILMREHDSDWQTNDGARFMSEQKIRLMFLRSLEVDAFITSELRRIEHEEYDVGDGRERVKDGEKFDEMLNMDAKPSRWVKADEMCLVTQGNRLVFRRRKAPQVKLPTVKAPEGCEWIVENNVVFLLQREKGMSVLCRVPVDKAHRDRLAARVAAFDEANGVQSVDFTSRVVDHQVSNAIPTSKGTSAECRVVFAGSGDYDQLRAIGKMCLDGTLVDVKVTAKP